MCRFVLKSRGSVVTQNKAIECVLAVWTSRQTCTIFKGWSWSKLICKPSNLKTVAFQALRTSVALLREPYVGVKLIFLLRVAVLMSTLTLKRRAFITRSEIASMSLHVCAFAVLFVSFYVLTSEWLSTFRFSLSSLWLLVGGRIFLVNYSKPTAETFDINHNANRLEKKLFFMYVAR